MIFPKRHKKGFTLIEMLISFFLAMSILSVFYFMHITYQNRLVKLMKKVKGQQAVRLFLTKLRQELKQSIEIYVPTRPADSSVPYEWQGSPRRDVVVMFLGRSNLHDYDGYAIKYEYIEEEKSIRYSEYKNRTELIRQGTFLGGDTQILSFEVFPTDLNEQILMQKFQVYAQIGYYDITRKEKKSKNELIVPKYAHLSVYPRTINTSLLIDVPQ
ncbi:MAG: prepilin-type N-terminal cleavage/methylation domain-containing protein [Candidatus Cloacimonetes bacterium]|nr:prepilin-type N-terminal cleavage/methylation domain-containing protein [Candidatus Cloacimonadota bacterium]